MTFVIVYRRRTTLQVSALLAGTLVLYASWTLGGWRWLLAPAIFFLTYSSFYPGKLSEEDRTHNVYAVVSVSSAGLIWLFLAHAWHSPKYLFPYTLAYAIHLSIIAWTLACIRFPNWYPRLQPALCVLESWLIMFLPYIAIQRGGRPALLQMAFSLPICAAAFWIFCRLQPRNAGFYSVEVGRWYCQAGVAFMPALLASFL